MTAAPISARTIVSKSRKSHASGIPNPFRDFRHVAGRFGRLLTGGVAALLLSYGCITEDGASSEDHLRVQVGELAPDFTVELFDGTDLRLSDLRGNVVLLTFFASWCPECREELAVVGTEVLDRFADDAFFFLPISRGESRSEIAAFRDTWGYTWTMGLDPDASIYGLYATLTVPRNFLLDPEGRIVSLTTGYDPAEFSALLDRAESLLRD